jgi:hypothetical protein
MKKESSESEEIFNGDDFVHADKFDQEINCISWGSPSSLLVRLHHPNDPTDPDTDRFYYINPRPCGLQSLERSGVAIREMHLITYINGILGLHRVKSITTWPTYNESGDFQTVLNCGEGKAFLVTLDGIIRLHILSTDWDGTGKYEFQKSLSQKSLSLT